MRTHTTSRVSSQQNNGSPQGQRHDPRAMCQSLGRESANAGIVGSREGGAPGPRQKGTRSNPRLHLDPCSQRKLVALIRKTGLPKEVIAFIALDWVVNDCDDPEIRRMMVEKAEGLL